MMCGCDGGCDVDVEQKGVGQTRNSLRFPFVGWVVLKLSVRR